MHGEAPGNLIHAEQGYGDTLQFVRYLPKIREMGGRVKLACQLALKRLLLDLPGLEGVTGGESPGPFDFHLPIMSLPKVFGLRFEEIEACNSPYLVDTDHTDLVPSDGSSKVGLVWRGSTINLKGCSGPVVFRTSNRSADLQFYSLQVDITEQERDVLQSYGGIDLSSQINDLADSAALTKHMDLILSVDTAQAHLAGGLGILFGCCWRGVPIGAGFATLKQPLVSFDAHIPADGAGELRIQSEISRTCSIRFFGWTLGHQ